MLNALTIIAEQRIADAIRDGEFDNLPGAGKPLPIEDLNAVPEEFRMAYKILKNAGYAPPEIQERKEMSRLADLLDGSPDEQTRLKSMTRLRFLLEKINSGKNAGLAERDEYYQKILARLEREERKNSPGR
ncbi:MAG: DUF1992 domain-containing protein [Desulfovibrio sp.]|nr:DUF1992 domain-containing protein [Desulfovibrio sp.]